MLLWMAVAILALGLFSIWALAAIAIAVLIA